MFYIRLKKKKLKKWANPFVVCTCDGRALLRSVCYTCVHCYVLFVVHTCVHYYVPFVIHCYTCVHFYVPIIVHACIVTFHFHCKKSVLDPVYCISFNGENKIYLLMFFFSVISFAFFGGFSVEVSWSECDYKVPKCFFLIRIQIKKFNIGHP